MGEINAAVEVLAKPHEVLRTLRRLCDSGFDERRLSVVALYIRAGGCGFSVPITDAALQSGIGACSFWDNVQQLLHGWSCFQMPKLGLVLAAGPLAGWINAVIKNEAMFSGLSSLGAGLCSIGIPRSLVPFYEAELKAGRFLLIAHGSTKDVEKARSTMDRLHRRSGHETNSSGFPWN